MKSLTIVVPLLLAAFLVDAAWASSCSDEFTCTENKKIWVQHEFSACSSIFGGFGSEPRSLEAKTQNLASKHLRASMKYLLLASEFNTWKTDRPGLKEYFSKMSDAAFDHAVNIIKHMTKRGGKLSNTFNVTMPSISYKVSEIEALTLVLDEEKHLANETINVIHSAGHGSKEHMRLPDGELAHFLAEEIAEKHADRIHDLAVHVNNLGAAIQDSHSKGQDPSFIIYMYDTQFM